MKIAHLAHFVAAIALTLPFAHTSDLNPSRLIATQKLDEQMEALSSKLAINQREMDPFGQVQDVEKKSSGTIPLGVKAKHGAIPFTDVVQTIDVVAVSPKQGRIMAGGRPYSIGQKMNVPFKGLNHLVELVSVATDQITYKNVKTGEHATAKFKGAIAKPLLRDDW